MPRPMPFYVNGSKRVKQRGGCGKKAVEVEKHTEGCEWMCVLGVWPSVKQSALSSISLWSIMHHC